MLAEPLASQASAMPATAASSDTTAVTIVDVEGNASIDQAALL
jgi:hypothetical protein